MYRDANFIFIDVTHRRYSTVERRAKCLAGPQYASIPEDCAISRLIFTELGLEDPDRLYVAARDNCVLHQESLILELHPDGSGRGILWPLLTVTQGGLIMACLPLVDSTATSRPPLSNQVSICQGIAFLSGLQAFMSAGSKALEPDILAARLDLLPTILLNICPLGTPVDTPHSAIFPFLAVPTPTGSQKQPAWKAGFHKGRSTVSVSVTETVRSMQYGNQNKQDLWDVYGTVVCKVRHWVMI